jgi:hypothetical protein
VVAKAAAFKLRIWMESGIAAERGLTAVSNEGSSRSIEESCVGPELPATKAKLVGVDEAFLDQGSDGAVGGNPSALGQDQAAA